MKCLCRTLNPVTVVEDKDGLFIGSKFDEVFSEVGLLALQKVRLYKIYILYILIIKTGFLIYLMRWGQLKDRLIESFIVS